MASKRQSSGPALRPRMRVMCGRDIALGPGKADLLELVRETGSLREAAAKLGMSYMRAWKLVQTMNHCFREPVVTPLRGGATGGGTKLTPTGEKALALYRELESASLEATQRTWTELEKLLAGS